MMGEALASVLGRMVPPACAEAIEWVRQQPGGLAEVWDACPNGGWMLWLVRRLKIPVDQEEVNKVRLAFNKSNRAAWRRFDRFLDGDGVPIGAADARALIKDDLASGQRRLATAVRGLVERACVDAADPTVASKEMVSGPVDAAHTDGADSTE